MLAFFTFCPGYINFVFETDGTSWSHTETFLPGPLEPDFGVDVAVEGSVIAVGSARTGLLIAPGTVSVFEELQGSWTETAQLAASATNDDWFGVSVVIASGRIVAGAPLSGTPIKNGGRTFVYERGSTAWSLSAKLLPTSQSLNSRFGMVVGVHGDEVVATSEFDEIVFAFRLDCDGNQIVDTLQFANGEDCDGDTVLDSCELAAGGADLNQDGVLDECQQLDFTYCVGILNSEFCLPRMMLSGTPSQSDANPFDLTANDVLANKNGLLFYGLSGPAAVPFLGGTLCVQPPLARTAIQSSGSGVACDGVLAFDFNAWIQGGNDPLITVASVVNAQYWYRDPQTLPFGVGLSDAAEFIVRP